MTQERYEEEGVQAFRLRLREWHEYAEAGQQFVINLSLLTVPLLSAAVPAFLTGNAIAMYYPELLKIDPQAALVLGVISGLAIELLGIASVDNAFTLWAWNERYGEDDAKRAPFGMAVVIAGFYLIAVLTLVVFLKVWPVLAIWSLIPLSCLGVVSAASLALRKQHNDRVLGFGQWAKKPAKTTVKTGKNDARNGGNEGDATPAKPARVQPQPAPVTVTETAASASPAAQMAGKTRIQQEAIAGVLGAVSTGQVTSDAVLASILGRPEATARRWRKLAETEGVIHKNGDGRYHLTPPTGG